MSKVYLVGSTAADRNDAFFSTNASWVKTQLELFPHSIKVFEMPGGREVIHMDITSKPTYADER